MEAGRGLKPVVLLASTGEFTLTQKPRCRVVGQAPLRSRRHLF
jgi:hypothetical protein